MTYRNAELLPGFLIISRAFSVPLAFIVLFPADFLCTVLCGIDVEIGTVILLLPMEGEFWRRGLYSRNKHWQNGTEFTSVVVVPFKHSNSVVLWGWSLMIFPSSSFVSLLSLPVASVLFSVKVECFSPNASEVEWYPTPMNLHSYHQIFMVFSTQN